MAPHVPQYIKSRLFQQLSKKTIMFPVEVLDLNEQNHADDVKILQNVQQLIIDLYKEAEPDNLRVAKQGDQLARSRLSEAMKT